eukprot:scaffold4145_cov115-Isochrysis_galbana.AAC.25
MRGTSDSASASDGRDSRSTPAGRSSIAASSTPSSPTASSAPTVQLCANELSEGAADGTADGRGESMPSMRIHE